LLVGEGILGALSDFDHVDFGATAARARDEVDVLALAQAERLEQLPTGASFFHRVGGEAVANGVADALQQQCGDAGGGLQQSAGQRPRLSDAEVQRMVGDGAQLAVGLHHERHVGGLDRNLDEVEADFFEVAHLHLGGFHHGVGGETAVLFVERRVERTAVHPDADGHLAVAGLARHRFNVFGFADVARVETQAVHACFERSERHFVLVVNVGDDRDGRTRHDLGEAFGGLHLVAGAAHDVATGGGEGVDLLQRALHVGGLGDGHRLHADGGIAADGHLADVNLAGLLARIRGEDAGLGHDGQRAVVAWE